MEAVHRECQRYGIAPYCVEARRQGMQLAGEIKRTRIRWDWLLVAGATSIFVAFATMARTPAMPFHWAPAVLLIVAMVELLAVCGIVLWRTTRFH